MNNSLAGWNEVATGAILESFDNKVDNVAHIKPEERNYALTNSYTKSTADWRVLKPVHNTDLCIHCQNCWVYCPDTAIISRDKKMTGIDYTHCKGCGVCVEVCPTNPKSLWMFPNVEEIESALTKWPEKKEKSKD